MDAPGPFWDLSPSGEITKSSKGGAALSLIRRLSYDQPHNNIVKHRRMTTGMNFMWQRVLKRNNETTCESLCQVVYQSMIISTVPQKQCKII